MRLSPEHSLEHSPVAFSRLPFFTYLVPYDVFVSVIINRLTTVPYHVLVLY